MDETNNKHGIRTALQLIAENKFSIEKLENQVLRLLKEKITSNKTRFTNTKGNKMKKKILYVLLAFFN